MWNSLETYKQAVVLIDRVRLVENISYSIFDNESPLVKKVLSAMQATLNGQSKVPTQILSMKGMSGRRYRSFINTLIEIMPNPAYLEVGSWAGSTLCSAIYGNTLRALAIDNWSEFGGPSNVFFEEVSKYISNSIKLSVLNADFRDVPWKNIGEFNVFLFDGPHTFEDQRDGMELGLCAMEDEFVVIVDDWNWQKVRQGTLQALSRLNIDCLARIEILTSAHDGQPDVSLCMENSDWHDGYFIAVCRKK